jgi:hypothetical protein
VLAVAAFGGVKLTVSISVSSAGLISCLLLTPYQALPASVAHAEPDNRCTLTALIDIPALRAESAFGAINEGPRSAAHSLSAMAKALAS